MYAADRVQESVGERISGEEMDMLRMKDYTQTVISRLCIRLGEEYLPDVFIPIAADAVVKMHRRTYFEGIQSEGTSGLTTSFVEDVLKEYETEIEVWNIRKSASGTGGKVVFL